MSHQPTPQSPEAAEEGAGGTLLTSLLPILQGVANNVDIGQLVGQAVGGGVSGAILTAIVGLIKNVMAGEGAK